MDDSSSVELGRAHCVHAGTSATRFSALPQVIALEASLSDKMRHHLLAYKCLCSGVVEDEWRCSTGQGTLANLCLCRSRMLTLPSGAPAGG